MSATIKIHHFTDTPSGRVAITLDPGNGLPPKTFEVNLQVNTQTSWSWPEPLFVGVFREMSDATLIARSPYTTTVEIAVPPEHQTEVLLKYNEFQNLIILHNGQSVVVDYGAFPAIFGGINCSTFVYGVVGDLGIDITQHFSFPQLQAGAAGRQMFDLFLRDTYESIFENPARAITGHSTLSEIQRYAEQYNQPLLADTAIDGLTANKHSQT